MHQILESIIKHSLVNRRNSMKQEILNTLTPATIILLIKRKNGTIETVYYETHPMPLMC